MAVASAVFWSGSIQADDSFNKQPVPIDANQELLSAEERALLYLSCAYSNLLSKNYPDAFDDYRKALDTLPSSQNSGMEFLISFGMAVACDNLHLSCDSQQQMARIRNLIDTCAEEESDVPESTSQEERKVANCLTYLASMTTSPETRSVLLSFVSEIFPTSLASHSRPSFQATPPSTLACKTAIMAKPCRSFWKTLKKIKEAIVDTWKDFFGIYKDIKEIRNDLKGDSEQTILEII